MCVCFLLKEKKPSIYEIYKSDTLHFYLYQMLRGKSTIVRKDKHDKTKHKDNNITKI